MNQDTIKTMLLELYKTDVDFSVTYTGKSSSKVNGLYKPATHEILLHVKKKRLTTYKQRENKS